MQNKGGLPAIPKYDIERYHWLHELRQLRAFKRVHGVEKSKTHIQRELCKARKEHYVK